MNNTAKIYLKQVESELPWAGNERRRFIGFIRGSVSSFCRDNPDVTVDELQEEFGNPKSLAEEFIEDVGIEQLQRSANIARYFKLAIIFFLCFLVIYYIAAFITRVDDTRGTSTESVVTTTISDNTSCLSRYFMR